MSHIRIVDRVQGRRINDSGTTHTLCGGEMTDRDLSWRDAKRDFPNFPFLECPKCREAVRRNKS